MTHAGPAEEEEFTRLITWCQTVSHVSRIASYCIVYSVLTTLYGSRHLSTSPGRSLIGARLIFKQYNIFTNSKQSHLHDSHCWTRCGDEATERFSTLALNSIVLRQNLMLFICKFHSPACTWCRNTLEIYTTCDETGEETVLHNPKYGRFLSAWQSSSASSCCFEGFCTLCVLHSLAVDIELAVMLSRPYSWCRIPVAVSNN